MFSEIEAELTRIASTEQKTLPQAFADVSAAVRKIKSSSFKPFVVTVAGTNGKGSVVHGLSSLLKESDLTVGSFFSPHLIHFNERICLNHKPVSDEQLMAALHAIEPLAQEYQLNYFQCVFCMSVLIFQSAKCDLLLLEVGMGGLYDPVNAINTDCAVITSIDMDHAEFLGDTVDKIAAQKLGIARKCRPLFYADNNPQAVIVDSKVPSAIAVYQRDFSYPDAWPAPAMLPVNAAVTLAVYQYLQTQFTLDADLESDIPMLSAPGRCQLFHHRCEIILDVAHNKAGATHLAAFLAGRSHKRTTAIFWAKKNKDIDGMVGALSAQVDEWVRLPNNDPDEIRRTFEQTWRNCDNDDRLLVFGSFELVGPVLERVTQE